MNFHVPCIHLPQFIVCFRRKPDAAPPFSMRPQMVRKNTQQQQQQQAPAQQPTDPSFNPLQGVTFKPNPSSDVAVIGKSYMDKQNESPVPNQKSSHQTYSNNKPKKKQQPAKGRQSCAPFQLFSMS